ncbi:MAG: hypothetical protein AAF717_02205 [Bacteroidota bacterium]
MSSISNRFQVAKPSLRTIIDVTAHYVVALWILVLLYFLFDAKVWLGVNAGLSCAGAALLMIPIRVFALRVLHAHERDKYIKKIMDELVNSDPKD